MDASALRFADVIEDEYCAQRRGRILFDSVESLTGLKTRRRIMVAGWSAVIEYLSP